MISQLSPLKNPASVLRSLISRRVCRLATIKLKLLSVLRCGLIGSDAKCVVCVAVVCAQGGCPQRTSAFGDRLWIPSPPPHLSSHVLSLPCIFFSQPSSSPTPTRRHLGTAPTVKPTTLLTPPTHATGADAADGRRGNDSNAATACCWPARSPRLIYMEHR